MHISTSATQILGTTNTMYDEAPPPVRSATAHAAPPINTYGRWPLVGATALLPAWAVTAAGRRRLAEGGSWVAGLTLPILLAHQTEEWVRPGGFLPFANQEVLGSERPDWPLTPRIGFHVNVTAGWGSAALAALVWRRSPAVAAGVIAMEIGNAAMHIGMAVRRRRYNPGVASAALLMLPHAVAGAAWLARSGRLTRPGLAVAAGIGAAFSALPVTMKVRMLSLKNDAHRKPVGESDGAHR